VLLRKIVSPCQFVHQSTTLGVDTLHLKMIEVPEVPLQLEAGVQEISQLEPPDSLILHPSNVRVAGPIVAGIWMKFVPLSEQCRCSQNYYQHGHQKYAMPLSCHIQPPLCDKPE